MTSRDIITLLVIGGGVVLLIQFTGLKIWHALLVLAAGFYLALSAVGPDVHQFLSRIPGLFGR
jgi:hypothetical protein